MNDLDQWFLRLSRLPDTPHVHNLYSPQTAEGRTRLANLRRYFEQTLAHEPDTPLFGEVPSYQGSYRTGVTRLA